MKTKRTIRKYGWKPDIPDHRDYKYQYKRYELPKKVDLRDRHSLVYDQGQLGSCTSQALSMAYDFNRVMQKQDPTVPSRLFIYYNERVLGGNVNRDSGAYIRNGIKAMAKWGVCEEDLWPYVIKEFKTKPSEQAYNDAAQSPIKEYARLNNTNINELKECLSEGYGYVFGFAVYPSFESDEVARTGVMVIPEPNESMLGGHAVLALGYDDEKEHFIVRNSWGNKWGDKGHFYMPYSYMTNSYLCDDFWTIKLV